jgi:hypothetical protein
MRKKFKPSEEKNRGLAVEIVLPVDDIQASYEYVRACGYPNRGAFRKKRMGTHRVSR